MELVKGNRLNNRFKVIGSLGLGYKGRVFLVQDGGREDQVVALKVFEKEYIPKEAIKARLKNAIAQAQTLVHPNIVRPLEFVDGDDFVGIVSEHIEGEDIAFRLKESVLEINEIVNILDQVAVGLEELHANGLIHGNLSPANLILTKDDTVKVNDWIYHSFDNSEPSQLSFKVGSAHYIAPELLKTGSCDQRADIFSLGILGYELFSSVTKKLPESAEASAAIGITNVPRCFRQIIDKATHFTVAERYQSVSKFRTDLLKALTYFHSYNYYRVNYLFGAVAVGLMIFLFLLYNVAPLLLAKM